MEYKLSVILPVYNVASYLPQCLESLVNQSAPPSEIIAINDGSTDNCLSILHEYQEKLPQLVVINQENQGLSVARNNGLAIAKGECIHFLDSDDFLATNAYEVMLEVMEQSLDLDILLFNAYYHFEGRREDYLIYPTPKLEEKTSGLKWLKSSIQSQRFLHMVWLHCYRREFLSANNLQFIPQRIHEDVIWTTQTLLAATHVKYIHKPLIHYRIPIRDYASEVKDAKFLTLIDSSILNAKDLLAIAKSSPDKSINHLLTTQAIDGGLSVFHKIEQLHLVSNKQQANQIIKKQKYFALLLKNATSLKLMRKIISRYLKYTMANRRITP